jgi:uncharacterized protein YjiS (DUF1127 family)
MTIINRVGTRRTLASHASDSRVVGEAAKWIAVRGPGLSAGSAGMTAPIEAPVRRLARFVLAWLRQRAEERRPHGLSDHMLRDIGVSGRELGYNESTKWYDKR